MKMKVLHRTHVCAWSMRVLALWLGFLCCLAAHASAQKHAARAPQPEDLLPQSDLDVDDPIGVDAESRNLEREAAAHATPAPSERELSAERARFGPQPPPVDVRAGEVLTAHPSTREVAHRVQVDLDPGVARIAVEMEFESRAAKPTELRYRLAVPEGSEPTALEVCNAAGCRNGLLETRRDVRGAYEAALLARRGPNDRALPIARAASEHDARGAAIVVYAAPVLDKQPLRVRVTYASELPLHGGVVRLVLPARGMDPEAAPAEVHVTTTRLADVRVGGQPALNDSGFSVDPWTEIPVFARAKNGEAAHAAAWQFACGTRQCARAEVWAGPRPSTPVDLVIALDLSPSTEGPARGRLVASIGALLAAAPAGSRVRAIGFAARGVPLIETAMDPSQVQLAPFSRAVAEAELGSATRFEAVWDIAQAWFGKRARRTLRPLIVIVGDGGLTEGESRAFDRARSAGVEVSALNLADRATSDALRARVLRGNGIVLEAGSEGDAAARGRDSAPLAERLSALFAPTVARAAVAAGAQRIDHGPLRAGEWLAYQTVARSLTLSCGSAHVPSGAPDRALGPALAARAARAGGQRDAGVSLVAVDARDLALAGRSDWPEPPASPKATCDRRGPAHRVSAISSDAQPVALAEERLCKPAPKAQVRSGNSLEIGAGMPSDPLLSMLRQRILPVARGCFRRDRAGRADYQKRAIFVFALAEREVVDAHVEGAIPDALRQCLLTSIDTLEVPRFSGVVKVRYPLITESVPLPEQIELRSETAGTLDRLFPGSDER
jgi:hypothetical protein